MISVPAVEKDRYYSVPVDRREYLQFRLHRQPRHWYEPGDYLVVGPDWKRRERLPGSSKVFSVDHPVRVRQLSDPAHQPRRFAERRKGAGRLQGAAAVGLPQATRASSCRRRSTSCRPQRRASRTTSSTISTLPLNSCPAPPEDEGHSRASSRRIGVGPGKSFHFKDLPIEP